METHQNLLGLKHQNGFQSAGRLSQSILQENGIQHSVLFPRNEQQKFGIGQHGSNDKTREEQGVTVYQNGEGKKFSFTKTKVQFPDDVKKTPTPLPRKPKRTEEPVYVNSLGEDVTSNESTNSNNDDSIAPKPNLSFLWKHHNSFRKTRCSGSTCDTGTVESLQENVYEELNSWYSNNHNHQKGEPLYMDAESLGLNCSTASAGYEKSDCSSIGTPPTSGEDGWVDVSESEFADSSNLKLREKSKISLKKRLCSKNFRPSLKISTKESEDSLMWDTVDDDECGSTSTESTVSDHLYETVCYQTVLYNEVTQVHCETINPEVGIQEWSNPSTCSKTEIHSEDDHHLVRNPCSTKSNSGLFMPVNIDRKRMRKGIRSSVLQGRLSGNMQESGKLGKKQLQSISRMITLLQKKKTSQLSKNQIKEKSTFYVKSSTDNLPVKSNEISTSKSMIQNPKKRSPVNALQRPKAPPPLPPVSSLCVERSENVPSTSSTAPTSLDKRGQREAQEVKDYDTLSVKEVRPKELAVSPSHMEEMEQSSTKGQNPFNEETSPLKLPCALLGKDSLLESILSSVKLDPEFRLSIVSSESSATREGYINMSDVESCPPSIRASDSRPMITEDKVMDVNVCSVRKRSGTLETVNSLFEEEPLYQFYQKDFQDRANCIQQCEDSDSEENIYSCLRNQSPDSEESSSSQSLIFKQSSTDLRQISLGGRRSLWCELPEVINSGLLQNILPQDLKLQEAMFEIITSEASYLKSLDVLLEHFMNCSEFNEFSPNCVLERMEREYLFSDIVPVREVSQRLLGDLEKRWSENLYISDICDILYDYASTKFSVYVKYCTNQIYQERTLKQLKKNKPEFVEILRRLEANPVCQCLDMHSFLILPMQRITRFPLLVDAIFHRLPQDSPKYELCKSTLAALNKVVAECNEGAKKIQRMEEIMLLSHQLEFRDCKAIPLISSSRWLVKKGGVTRLLFEDSAKYTFGRTARCLKISVYLFLFTDLLIITKKKSEENYTVIDYCPRNMVQVASLDQSLPSQLPFRSDVSKNLFQLIMLNNHEGKTVEMIFSCPLDSDRTRWIKAVTPPTSENPNERIYEQWDCPQVQCIEKYDAQEPDELSLEESDVVNVFRKTADGWYEGELIRDGTRGWFPSKHTLEVISSHVKARNLRQRYRLLVLTHTLVEEQRKAQLAQQKNKKS
ncbi:uncharacterized protein LOC143229972 isoform X2 [Tachypleus tridentatus]|uniref:uncharacterized protein LOC143229972 isoform X2 n=1 Tax=Tachypleus tridentatus TaxID=6853 RepID=UPI003FD66206